MADTPILNYKGKHDGPEIDKAVELALGLENPKSCPYYVHVSLSQPDYVLTIGLGDSEGNLFNHTEIDLPLESMVVNATYSNGNIILHLQDGTSTEPIPISALIAGLVSETRTIAGIDLKDDITQKELRDVLDVYTKDSVDQLVSDLENTINETLNEMKESLNGLSDITSEHDTQIKKNTSDIAINRTTLGTQKKNLFDFEKFLTEREATFTKESDEYTVTTNSALNTQKYYFAEENIRVIISGILTNVTSSNARISLIDTNGNVVNGYAIDATHTSTVSVAAGLKFDWSSTGRFKIDKLMIRSADITDDTYEPYVPSVNERLTANENDILLLDKNKMGYDYGYAYAQNASSTGWFKLASFKCEDTSANIAIATFYITGINCEQNGLLTVSVMANTGVGNGISSLGCSWAYVGRNYNGIVTIKPNDFKVVANVNGGYIDVELWCAVTTAYSGFKARLMNFEGRVVFHEKNIVTLYKSNIGEIKSTGLNNPDNASLSRERASINGLSVLLTDFETRLEALETALAQTTASE